MRGAREQTYATAAALATEAAIAELVARGTSTATGAVVPGEFVEAAIGRAEEVLGRPLTSGQANAVRGICGEGRRISLVLGVAGGQTLAAARRVGGSGSVLATDISPTILTYAAKAAAEAGLTNVETRPSRRTARRSTRCRPGPSMR